MEEIVLTLNEGHFTNVCKNGSILWVIANAANVNDVYDNNNIKYHVFQLVDITELKQTEKELELRNFKLQNLAQELSVAKEKKLVIASLSFSKAMELYNSFNCCSFLIL